MSLNSHLYSEPDASTSPVGVTPERLLSWLDGRWPVEIHEGRLSLAPNYQGSTLAQSLTRQGTPQQGEEAAARVLDYVEQLNRATDDIAARTAITSHPALVMAPPTGRRLDEVLRWHLLKARLEVSGATVFQPAISNSIGAWTRDRYTLAPDGSPVFHRILTRQDQERLGWGAPATSLSPEEFQRQHDPAIPNRAEQIGRISHELQSQLQQVSGRAPVTLGGFVEGGNVLQHPQSNSVFVGITAAPDGVMMADELRSAQELAQRMHMRLVPVAIMKNPPFYHLDTFMSVLPDGSVIIFPDATSRQSLRAIRQTVPEARNRLELRQDGPLGNWDDPRLLTTNFVTINGNLFAARTTPEIEQFASARGLHVYTGPYEFGGSGPHCQVNFLTRDIAPDGRSDIAAVEMPRVPDTRLRNITRDV